MKSKRKLKKERFQEEVLQTLEDKLTEEEMTALKVIAYKEL